MGEGWRKGERKNAAGVRLWGGLEEKQVSKRKGNGVRQGADDESSYVMTGSGLYTYPDGGRELMDTVRDR